MSKKRKGAAFCKTTIYVCFNLFKMIKPPDVFSGHATNTYG